ncbi:hypothetical protein [Pseudonocardia sp.]|uniref:hypothetical protein n=1 Tax=Pseudonocardia sp. TaxID=60912 RepID=UPI003D10C709
MSSLVLLPSWVVPADDAVWECERVAQRLIGLGPYSSTRRDAGVAAALVWFTLGEVSPMTARCCSESSWSTTPDARTGEPVRTWTCGVSREMARAESWVALSVAAGQIPPTAADWRSLGVTAAPARVDDPEFAYGVWRVLAWLLGSREDFPVHTSWHRAAGIPPERPHLYRPRRPRDPDKAWQAAEQACRDRARAEAQCWWRHVRAQVDAAATSVT